MIKAGDKAIDFTLLDQDGNSHTLSKYLKDGFDVLIYFYPKDDTPGCTTEACNFRDNNIQLRDLGIMTLGISKDSVKSHKKFAEKYNLNFPILSDDTTDIIKAYGAWREKKFMGRTYMGIERISLLVGKDGLIKKVYENVKPAAHTQEVISDAK